MRYYLNSYVEHKTYGGEDIYYDKYIYNNCRIGYILYSRKEYFVYCISGSVIKFIKVSSSFEEADYCLG
jgi:hypothetical protein